MKRRGSGTKPSRNLDRVKVIYSESRWQLLTTLRNRALSVLNALGSWGQISRVHGSVARGDVDAKSDVDILVPTNASVQLIEASLENGSLTVFSRELAQATPSHSPKAHLFLDPEQLTSVTVPLTPFRSLETEFYSFGGVLSSYQIDQDTRSPGCTKKLLLIEPTLDGHFESAILDQEARTAKLLGINIAIVKERVRVLTRRDTIGRTGMYLKIPLRDGESFDEILQQRADSDPALRRTLRNRH